MVSQVLHGFWLQSWDSSLPETLSSCQPVSVSCGHLSRMIWVKLMIARAISHAGVCDHGHVLLAQYCRPRGLQPHGVQRQAIISTITRLGADRYLVTMSYSVDRT